MSDHIKDLANEGMTVAPGMDADPCIIDDMYANREPRIYTDYAPALRSERSGLKVVEPNGLSFVNGDVCHTIRAGGHGSTDRHSWDMVECNTTLRIRKLTPKECFRLQGFDDESFHRAEAVNSNTQLYK